MLTKVTNNTALVHGAISSALSVFEYEVLVKSWISSCNGPSRHASLVDILVFDVATRFMCLRSDFDDCQSLFCSNILRLHQNSRAGSSSHYPKVALFTKAARQAIDCPAGPISVEYIKISISVVTKSSYIANFGLRRVDSWHIRMSKQSIKGRLPPLAPFPPANVRQAIETTQWHSYLQIWIALINIYLGSDDHQFSESAIRHSDNVEPFIATYLASAQASNDPVEVDLRRLVYLLTYRILSAQNVPASLLKWQVLSDLCRSFRRTSSLAELLASIWRRKSTELELSLAPLKKSLIGGLESDSHTTAVDDLRRLLPLVATSSEAGTYFMVGSDLLDAVSSVYPRVQESARANLVIFVYSCLIGLLQQHNFSSLSDHAYSLKSSADASKKSGSPNLLADLVTNTDIIQAININMAGLDTSRADNISKLLTPFRDDRVLRPAARKKAEKGKARAQNGDSFGHGADMNGIHVHRMSLVTQVQDLFPDLGLGFIMKLLDAYNEDIEQATAALLEDNLPSHLATSDRTEGLPTPMTPQEKIEHLMPRPTPPQTPRAEPIQPRRNIYDNDDFDRLAIATGNLHIGGVKASQNTTADELMANRDPSSHANHKAAILSALSAFDADDDEHDDTYDVDDVGVAGSIDQTVGADGDAAADAHEESLFQAWKSSHDVFNRDAATRRSKARLALKQETQMTDEAIEGWAIMLAKDSRKVRRLEAKYATFMGQQNAIERTAWRGGGDTDGSDTDGGGPSGRGRGRGRGAPRGFGRGGGGPGRGSANVAGPSSDTGTQRARDRKETNKGSRANHNRRDQRARKMARSGAGGMPG